MKRSEMIEFIKSNPFSWVTHPLFDPEEYLFADNQGRVFDERGYLFEDWVSKGRNGLRMRVGGLWENGWTVKEKQK